MQEKIFSEDTPLYRLYYRCLRYDETMNTVESFTATTSHLPESSNTPKPLIIVMHASVGSGHRSAALAVAEALTLMRDEQHLASAPCTKDNNPFDVPFQAHQRDCANEDMTPVIPANLEVEVLDVLDFGRIVFDGNKAASLFTGATRPIYDFTWRFTLTGRLLWAGGTIWSRTMYPAFSAYIEKKRPAAIICTHITAANVALGARMLNAAHFPIVCVPTDYETEGLWPHRYTNLFCVANEPMAETLRPRKVEENRILITGIPTRDSFRRSYDRAKTRADLGLPADKFVVLVLAGAYLPRPYVHFRATLDKLLPSFHNQFCSMHFVFIAGNDTDYAAQLHKDIEILGATNITVCHYVEEMAALMAASDLAICKSGGLTVTECLCAQVPMILLGRAYGQEKVNARMLTSLGAAMHVTTGRELLEALGHIEQSPESARAMLINGSFLRKPHAARTIAAATLRLMHSTPRPDDPIYHKHLLHFYWGKKPAHTR